MTEIFSRALYHHWFNGLSPIQRLPLSETMLNYCRLDKQEQNYFFMLVWHNFRYLPNSQYALHKMFRTQQTVPYSNGRQQIMLCDIYKIVNAIRYPILVSVICMLYNDIRIFCEWNGYRSLNWQCFVWYTLDRKVATVPLIQYFNYALN